MCSSAILPAMAARLRVGIVGAGNFAVALAASLTPAGYRIAWVMARHSRSSLARAEALAKQLGSVAIQDPSAAKPVDLVWFCVPDSQIAIAARSLADKMSWKGVIALHSSGALSS